MENKTVVIARVSRQDENGNDTHLDLRPGVNVIVGPHNAGKTKWLETIDYLLGDDISAAQRQEDDIFVKYVSASASLVVAGEEMVMVIERRWKQYGEMNKVIVNEHPMSLDDYRALLLEKLSIPSVHYPQGNPYAPRSWPELGWRSLMRHIYRRQKSWTDLAAKQFPVEQHACVLQFLGVAEKVFSTDYGDLITKQRRIEELRSNREHFIAMLQEVSREVIDSAELGVAISPSSLDAAVSRLNTERETLEIRRSTVLADLAKPQAAGVEQMQPNIITAMSNALVRMQRDHEIASIALQRARDRLVEVEVYRKVLSQELDRMECAREAGSILADLKVTNCPACDQEVYPESSHDGHCYVCKQSISSIGSSSSSGKRLQFEVEQLKGDMEETEDLIASLSSDVERLSAERESFNSELIRLEQQLRPTRSAVAAILPPELAVIDMNIGRIQEQEQQLGRVRLALSRREDIAKQILQIQEQVGQLDIAVASQTAQIDYGTLSDLLEDAMNTYLNAIDKLSADAWTQNEIYVQLRERDFRIKVGKSDWHTKLGGTLELYFLLAYNYALMHLTPMPGTHYPGFALIDFPPVINGVSVKDKENFVLGPFIDFVGVRRLCTNSSHRCWQCLRGFAGRSPH